MKEIFLDVIDSTHLYAKNNAPTFHPKEITCISAEEQTAGRGQFQRKWISPRGVNLYISFYFQIPRNAAYVTTLASLMIKSIQKVLEGENIATTMKWPNDLLLNGKKIAGALGETEFHENTIEVILSFGLNVNMETKDFAHIDQPVTSLAHETGKIWDKKKLLKKIQEQFVIDFSNLQSAQNYSENL